MVCLKVYEERRGECVKGGGRQWERGQEGRECGRGGGGVDSVVIKRKMRRNRISCRHESRLHTFKSFIHTGIYLDSHTLLS